MRPLEKAVFLSGLLLALVFIAAIIIFSRQVGVY